MNIEFAEGEPMSTQSVLNVLRDFESKNSDGDESSSLDETDRTDSIVREERSGLGDGMVGKDMEEEEELMYTIDDDDMDHKNNSYKYEEIPFRPPLHVENATQSRIPFIDTGMNKEYDSGKENSPGSSIGDTPTFVDNCDSSREPSPFFLGSLNTTPESVNSSTSVNKPKARRPARKNKNDTNSLWGFLDIFGDEDDDDDDDKSSLLSENQKQYKTQLNVCLLHLDLGIGGAERLMVNVALTLHSLNHNVTIFTTHHDVNHCFEETKPPLPATKNTKGNSKNNASAGYLSGGILGKKILVFGDWLPRHLPLVGATALCSNIRMVYLTFVALYYHILGDIAVSLLNSEESVLKFVGFFMTALFFLPADKKLPRQLPQRSTGTVTDNHGSNVIHESKDNRNGRSFFKDSKEENGETSVNAAATSKSKTGATYYVNPRHIDMIILDGVSIPLVLTAIASIPSIFYCHFPDKLLVDTSVMTSKSVIARLKRFYRNVLDNLEELSTGCANLVMVNSCYTAMVFKESFTMLGQHVDPLVVYPTLEPPQVGASDNGVTKGTPRSASQSAQPLSSHEQEDINACLSYLPMNKGKAGMKLSDTSRHLFVSLNRYERKKSVEVSLQALGYVKKQLKMVNEALREKIIKVKDDKTASPPTEQQDLATLCSVHDITPKNSVPAESVSTENNTPSKYNNPLLIIAGGYDSVVAENVEYQEELKAKCRDLHLSYLAYTEKGVPEECCSSTGERIFIDRNADFPDGDSTVVDVIFRRSISTLERSSLLSITSGLLYTPANEHFGIVPLESMAAGAPVVACNSGGPKETVLSDETGFLVQQTASGFGEAMCKLIGIDKLTVHPRSRDAIGNDSIITVNGVIKSKYACEMGHRAINHVHQRFHSNVLRRQFKACLQILVPSLITLMPSGRGMTRYIGTSGARIRTSSNDESAATFVPFGEEKEEEEEEVERTDSVDSQGNAALLKVKEKHQEKIEEENVLDNGGLKVVDPAMIARTPFDSIDAVPSYEELRAIKAQRSVPMGDINHAGIYDAAVTPRSSSNSMSNGSKKGSGRFPSGTDNGNNHYREDQLMRRVDTFGLGTFQSGVNNRNREYMWEIIALMGHYVLSASIVVLVPVVVILLA